MSVFHKTLLASASLASLLAVRHDAIGGEPLAVDQLPMSAVQVQVGHESLQSDSVNVTAQTSDTAWCYLSDSRFNPLAWRRDGTCCKNVEVYREDPHCFGDMLKTLELTGIETPRWKARSFHDFKDALEKFFFGSTGTLSIGNRFGPLPADPYGKEVQCCQESKVCWKFDHFARKGETRCASEQCYASPKIAAKAAYEDHAYEDHDGLWTEERAATLKFEASDSEGLNSYTMKGDYPCKVHVHRTEAGSSRCQDGSSAGAGTWS